MQIRHMQLTLLLLVDLVAHFSSIGDVIVHVGGDPAVLTPTVVELTGISRVCLAILSYVTTYDVPSRF
jgi:hypothetical protein